jgi:uncharacterized protein (DUF1697 family)
MPVIISMLRGINVGASNRIKMDALRGVYEALGLEDVRTYVQSGNVVFYTEQGDLAGLASRIEDGIERAFGFRSTVILRSAADMTDVVARNPFAERPDLDGAKLLVTFLAFDPDPELIERIRALRTDLEEVYIDGRELFVYFPNGIAKSKLPANLDKILKIPSTSRNWNSVTKMLEMAETLAH